MPGKEPEHKQWTMTITFGRGADPSDRGIVVATGVPLILTGIVAWNVDGGFLSYERPAGTINIIPQARIFEVQFVPTA